MFVATRKQRLEYIADRLRRRRAARRYGIAENQVTQYHLKRHPYKEPQMTAKDALADLTKTMEELEQYMDRPECTLTKNDRIKREHLKGQQYRQYTHWRTLYNQENPQ